MAHGDLTGNAKVALEKEYAAERELAAKNMAMITAQAEQEKSDEVVELKTNEQIEAEKPRTDGDLEIHSVDESEKIMTFRVNSNLENVTIGHDNNYDFEQGRTYKAPHSVYWHLECLGLIWH